MATDKDKKELAVWALTENGLKLAGEITAQAGRCDLFVSATVADPPPQARVFDSLGPCVEGVFTQYQGHIFIMAAGIVVRVIARLLVHKTKDPAVVVVDDAGRFCVSLVSGHLGGANDLAEESALWLGAIPVVTTATDAHGLPSVDILAREHGLAIENPQAIRLVNRAILDGKRVAMVDPYGFFKGVSPDHFKAPESPDASGLAPRVQITDSTRPYGPTTLMLRPKTLCVGIGCRKGVSGEALKCFLKMVFESEGLSTKSIRCLATVDIKATEPGIRWLAEQMDSELRLFSSRKLSSVKDVPNPSFRVQQHIGAKSVCEAAAMLAARTRRLIVTKKKIHNATIAVARRSCSS